MHAVVTALPDEEQGRPHDGSEPTEEAVGGWGPGFSTGVTALDLQHTEIADRLLDLERSVRTRCSKEIVCEFLAEFAELAICHFEDEERLMGDCAYPGLGAHRREHQRLLTELESFADEYSRTGSLPFAQVLEFLWTWVIEHLIEWDGAYLPYLQGRVAIGP